MKILVTGSNGTLGIPLLRELRKRGHTAYACDMAHSEDPQYIRCDVRQFRQLENIFQVVKPDLVYHLAAEFGRNNGEAYYEQLWSTNQVGTENLIRLCLANQARIVLAGSSEAYGDSGLASLREDVLDDKVHMFHNNYALSKWVQERQVMISAKRDGLKAVILRFFNAYGEGEYYSTYRSVVCLFCYRLLHDLPITIYRNGHREFLYIDDWTRTVANVAEKFDTLPRGSNFGGVPVYNIGGEEYKSIEDMAQLVIEEIGRTVPIDKSKINYVDEEIANVANKRPDLTLAQRDLDHKCKVPLTEGIQRTVRWMQSVYGKQAFAKEA